MKPLKPKTKMNKTEQRYNDFLELRRRAGEILDYRFEPFNLRLADNTYYRIDFYVVFTDHFEVHEVKGFWRDDARVKFKVAAEQFPWWKFVTVYYKRGQWVFE